MKNRNDIGKHNAITITIVYSIHSHFQNQNEHHQKWVRCTEKNMVGIADVVFFQNHLTNYLWEREVYAAATQCMRMRMRMKRKGESCSNSQHWPSKNYDRHQIKNICNLTFIHHLVLLINCECATLASNSFVLVSTGHAFERSKQ